MTLRKLELECSPSSLGKRTFLDVTKLRLWEWFSGNFAGTITLNVGFISFLTSWDCVWRLLA